MSDAALAEAVGRTAQSESSWLIEGSVAYIDDIALALLVLLVSVIVGWIVSAAIKRVGRHRSVQSHRVFRLLAGSLNTIIVIAGLVSCLGTLGVDVTAMVAGLGLTGFAVGFALKDAVANLVAGLLIVMYKPFDIGDEIEVAGQTGTVVDIDLRYVTIRGAETDVMVPNNSFVTNIIKRRFVQPADGQAAIPD